jgi:hypothetical protein
MKQYKITSENIGKDSGDDAYLDPNDPIHELKIVEYLAGLNAQNRLQEYNLHLQNQNNEGSNISKTAFEKSQLMKKHNIKPGTPEWFKIWFTLPYLTNTDPLSPKFKNKG